MLTFVIPAFESMFKDFGGGSQNLPKLTLFMVGVSHNFVTYFPFIVVAVVALVFGFGYMNRTPGGKAVVHKSILKLPIIGPVLRKIAVARFTRTLGTLLQSGVPILDALEICAVTSGNVVIEVAFNNIQKSQRHESGYALRFPRILRLRPDKPVSEIDTLERVAQLYGRQITLPRTPK